jgi:hypothetical protein
MPNEEVSSLETALYSGVDADILASFGDSNAVNTRRQNPACIAGAFTGREQAFTFRLCIDSLRVMRSGDEVRFDAGQHRVMQRVTLDLLLERRQGFADRFDGEVRQARARSPRATPGL